MMSGILGRCGVKQMDDTKPLYEKLIYENQDKFYELRLTVSDFRDKQYLNIRKYFQSYEGDFVPSREGISMEASLHNIFALLEGLIELCSLEESKEVIDRYFKERVDALSISDPKP